MMGFEFDIENENAIKIDRIARHLTKRIDFINERIKVLEKLSKIQFQITKQCTDMQEIFSENFVQLIEIMQGGKKKNG